MAIHRTLILRRGLGNRCPRCGGKTLFAKGFDMHHACPDCGLSFALGEGFFLGSMALNYAVTCVGFLLPVLIVTLLGLWPVNLGIALALVGALAFPALFYRSSRSWWLAAYYFVLPHELAEGEEPSATREPR